MYLLLAASLHLEVRVPRERMWLGYASEQTGKSTNARGELPPSALQKQLRG
jgi:hypothetical protein